MYNCPYRKNGCTFQAISQAQVDEHVLYMTSVVDDDEHLENPPTKTEPCQMCGEGIAVDDMGLQMEDEVGEFWDPETESSLWGHASCGLERGLEIA